LSKFRTRGSTLPSWYIIASGVLQHSALGESGVISNLGFGGKLNPCRAEFSNTTVLITCGLQTGKIHASIRRVFGIQRSECVYVCMYVCVNVYVCVVINECRIFCINVAHFIHTTVYTLHRESFFLFPPLWKGASGFVGGYQLYFKLLGASCGRNKVWFFLLLSKTQPILIHTITIGSTGYGYWVRGRRLQLIEQKRQPSQPCRQRPARPR